MLALRSKAATLTAALTATATSATTTSPSTGTATDDVAMEQPWTGSHHPASHHHALEVQANHADVDEANDADIDDAYSDKTETSPSSKDTERNKHQREGVWRNQYPINQTGQQGSRTAGETPREMDMSRAQACQRGQDPLNGQASQQDARMHEHTQSAPKTAPPMTRPELPQSLRGRDPSPTSEEQPPRWRHLATTNDNRWRGVPQDCPPSHVTNTEHANQQSATNSPEPGNAGRD